ncbi:tetratricopeptide repeat protein [Agrobacterium tumefaciens]|uniref:tetratricopeptide repeat protein n=1 Tax=Agrobacterium tumefaciens TaxID=358 RepID=UPI00122FD726|nr:tetratricopeptide repeat protein [Agrobacterium tumefaciens]
MQDIRKKFEARLASGHDSAMLRLTLGKGCLDDGELIVAISHLRRALELDPDYSAAWVLLGKVQSQSGDTEGACDTYRKGIEVAERRGELQSAKQMSVFLKRLQRS